MSEDSDLLHRQVNPAWVQDGRVSSQAFSPTPKDSGLLSVYDGRQITAEASYIHFTTVQKLKAVGTVSVSCNEILSVGLSWRLDPEPYPEHAVIDYTDVSSAAQKKAKSQALAERARQRGWTYEA